MADDSLTAALERWHAIEQAATKGEWYAEPPTGAGRVWVQIGRKLWADADCEPLFNVRYIGTPANEEKRRQEYKQREADAAFIVTSRTAMPRLLAAVRAALEKAEEWSVESESLEGGHRGLANHGADGLRTAMYALSVALKDCTDALREAITRELTGKGDSDERGNTSHCSP